jgi:hypothetical protein
MKEVLNELTELNDTPVDPQIPAPQNTTHTNYGPSSLQNDIPSSSLVQYAQTPAAAYSGTNYTADAIIENYAK